MWFLVFGCVPDWAHVIADRLQIAARMSQMSLRRLATGSTGRTHKRLSRSHRCSAGCLSYLLAYDAASFPAPSRTISLSGGCAVAQKTENARALCHSVCKTQA